MTLQRKELVKKGWTVVSDENATFRLKNGPWSAIGGFRCETSAWKWLEKIKEPRSPKALIEHEMWIGKIAARERAFIKTHR